MSDELPVTTEMTDLAKATGKKLVRVIVKFLNRMPDAEEQFNCLSDFLPRRNEHFPVGKQICLVDNVSWQLVPIQDNEGNVLMHELVPCVIAARLL